MAEMIAVANACIRINTRFSVVMDEMAAPTSILNVLIALQYLKSMNSRTPWYIAVKEI